MNKKLIYSSLPPQIKGQKYGNLIIRIIKVNNLNNTLFINYKIKFYFWGQQDDDIVIITLPWKVGLTINELIFPIRVNRLYFEEYLYDMNELRFEIIDSNGLPYGYAILNMESVINNNLLFRDSILIYQYNSPKTPVAKMFLEFLCQFDEEISSSAFSPQLTAFQRVEVCILFLILFIIYLLS